MLGRCMREKIRRFSKLKINTPVQRPDVMLKIMTCEALRGLMCEDDIAKDLFTAKHGEEVLSNNLQIEHMGLRSALCHLIATSVTDEGADAYLQLGTVHL